MALPAEYSYLWEMYKIPRSRISSIGNETELIDLLRNDFFSVYAHNFIEYSHLPLETWSSLLPVSKRTLQRQLVLKDHKMDFYVAEAIVEIGEIYRTGLQAFENDMDRLILWFKTKNAYLNGRTPLSVMDSHKGRELVKDELLRIEYGGFA